MADANTSKLCNRCGLVKLFTEFNKDAKNTTLGLQSKCRSCQKEVRHLWYVANREREIAKVVQWTKDNPEAARAKDRLRAIRHPGRTTKYSKASALRNPRRTRELHNAWKRNHPEKVRESARKSYRKNPDKDLSKQHARRLLLATRGNGFTNEEINNLFDMQKGRCAACKTSIKKKFHRDHILPLAKGGANTIENIQLLCVACNCRKSAKHPVDFMQENGYLL